jgi:hypothetical protein
MRLIEAAVAAQAAIGGGLPSHRTRGTRLPPEN